MPFHVEKGQMDFEVMIGLKIRLVKSHHFFMQERAILLL